jgi:methionyl aminopeptidase
MISTKNESEIEQMRKAGKIVAEVLSLMQSMVREGVSTFSLNEAAEKLILARGATPSFKGYGGFPAATCMSVDEVVVHGFPSKRPLREGEILSVDVGAFFHGFHSDAARTFPVGIISPEKQRLIKITEECFFVGMQKATEGAKLGDVSAAIQRHAESHGYSVVRTMTGHGIGRKLHEDPSIPNYGQEGRGITLKKGYALAIEPMINMGGYEVTIDRNDGWTCRTADKKPSAHYENTLIITEGYPEILTLYDK